MLCLKYLGIVDGPPLVPSAYHLIKTNLMRIKQHQWRSNQLECQVPANLRPSEREPGIVSCFYPSASEQLITVYPLYPST